VGEKVHQGIFYWGQERVSGVKALANPHRIKAAHRRRRKFASGQSVQRYYDPQIGRFLSVDPVSSNPSTGGNFNRYWYANNNPYTFVDPDGRCAAKTGTRICIHAKNFNSARSTGRSAQGSATMDQAVKAQGGEVRTKPGARQEQLGSLNRQSDGSLKVEKIANAETGRTKTADTASGNPPSNAQAIVHGHITQSVADDRSSRGDAGAVVVLQTPNYAVAQDGRVIVHEVVNGRYQVRMVEGRMNNAEIRHFKSEVNERQEDFYDRN